MNQSNERRVHDPLRRMVEKACEGLAGGTQTRIKHVARQAYYLGVGDGIRIQKEKKDE